MQHNIRIQSTTHFAANYADQIKVCCAGYDLGITTETVKISTKYCELTNETRNKYPLFRKINNSNENDHSSSIFLLPCI